MESVFDGMASSRGLTTPMPPEREALVEVLIDADTVVAPIALVARAVFVACERLKNSSGAAMCRLPHFGDRRDGDDHTVLTPATDGDGDRRAADERPRRHERSEQRRVRLAALITDWSSA